MVVELSDIENENVMGVNRCWVRRNMSRSVGCFEIVGGVEISSEMSTA
jgi:hypothetical protein